MESFDYVVVGGGTAGCILTNRLSASGASVCLLEAGPADRHPLIHIPAGYIRNVYSHRFTWGFMSAPTKHTAGRSFMLPQGRVLGGSSSINGLNYIRGQPADYDGWAQAGNTGWAYSDVLPYFKRSETYLGAGDDAVRGRSGELPISDLDLKHPVCEAFIRGTAELGIERNPDYNSGNQEGVGYFQRTVHRGYRYSAAKAFLSPVKGRANVSIRPNSLACSIVFDGQRARGIRYYRDTDRSKAIEIHANRAVILTAGALNTPKLLQLSGIGDGQHLQSLGITVRNNLPGVGQNLRDHYGIRMVSKLKGVRTFNTTARGLPLAGEILKWLVGKPSVLAVSPSLVHVFCRSHEAADRPDLEFVMTPASFRNGTVGLLDTDPGMTVGVWQMHPKSAGSVKAVTTDVFAAPEINPNYLGEHEDRQTLLRAMKLGRKMMQTGPLAPMLTGSTDPGPERQSDDELLEWARERGITAYHMIGSARMGLASDPTTVVDSQLRVHGIEGLRIADASIMPNMPSGNTNAPTMMIAEKAADMILSDHA